jgi:hypothetical protein
VREVLISLTRTTRSAHLIFLVLISGPLPQSAVTHTVHVPWRRLRFVVAPGYVRAEMELEAYKQNPAKERLLYTGHFIVVLLNTAIAVSQK